MGRIRGDAPRAILVGCARHTALPDIPAAHHSVQALRSALTGPGSGWPTSRVTVLEDPVRGGRVTRLVEALLQDAADTLFFYYVGHARLTDDGDVKLAVADSDGDDESTWLRVEDLLGPIGAHDAPDKLVVLDCCFAEIPPGVTDVDDLADRVERSTGAAGALVFCLASREAVYDDRAHGMTYLAHALVRSAPNGLDPASAAGDVARLALTAGRLRPEPEPDREPDQEPEPRPDPERTPQPEQKPQPRDDDAGRAATFRVSVPPPVRAFEWVARVVVAVLGVALGQALADHAVPTVTVTVVAWAMLAAEVHVAWWKRVEVRDDALVLRRDRRPDAIVFRAKPFPVDWRLAGIERVVIGRARGLTRVTLHVSPEAAARVWNAPPFTGFGGYRYGIMSGVDRGIPWPLGDVHAPVEDVASAFRAAVPPGVAVDVVLNGEPRYHRARRWPLVTYLVMFGGVLVGLAVVG